MDVEPKLYYDVITNLVYKDNGVGRRELKLGDKIRCESQQPYRFYGYNPNNLSHMIRMYDVDKSPSGTNGYGDIVTSQKMYYVPETTTPAVSGGSKGDSPIARGGLGDTSPSETQSVVDPAVCRPSIDILQWCVSRESKFVFALPDKDLRQIELNDTLFYRTSTGGKENLTVTNFFKNTWTYGIQLNNGMTFSTTEKGFSALTSSTFTGNPNHLYYDSAGQIHKEWAEGLKEARFGDIVSNIKCGTKYKYCGRDPINSARTIKMCDLDQDKWISNGYGVAAIPILRISAPKPEPQKTEEVAMDIPEPKEPKEPKEPRRACYNRFTRKIDYVEPSEDWIKLSLGDRIKYPYDDYICTITKFENGCMRHDDDCIANYAPLKKSEGRFSLPTPHYHRTNLNFELREPYPVDSNWVELKVGDKYGIMQYEVVRIDYESQSIKTNPGASDSFANFDKTKDYYTFNPPKMEQTVTVGLSGGGLGDASPSESQRDVDLPVPKAKVPCRNITSNLIRFVEPSDEWIPMKVGDQWRHSQGDRWTMAKIEGARIQTENGMGYHTDRADGWFVPPVSQEVVAAPPEVSKAKPQRKWCYNHEEKVTFVLPDSNWIEIGGGDLKRMAKVQNELKEMGQCEVAPATKTIADFEFVEIATYLRYKYGGKIAINGDAVIPQSKLDYLNKTCTELLEEKKDLYARIDGLEQALVDRHFGSEVIQSVWAKAKERLSKIPKRDIAIAAGLGILGLIKVLG